jgi:hypothetical protein
VTELNAELLGALSETEVFLRRHGFDDVADRIQDLQVRLATGDHDAIQTALSECTGSMGSLRDVFIYAGDVQSEQAANQQLDRLVERVLRLSQAALH